MAEEFESRFAGWLCLQVCPEAGVVMLAEGAASEGLMGLGVPFQGGSLAWLGHGGKA